MVRMRRAELVTHPTGRSHPTKGPECDNEGLICDKAVSDGSLRARRLRGPAERAEVLPARGPVTMRAALGRRGRRRLPGAGRWPCPPTRPLGNILDQLGCRRRHPMGEAAKSAEGPFPLSPSKTRAGRTFRSSAPPRYLLPPLSLACPERTLGASPGRSPGGSNRSTRGEPACPRR